MLRIFVAAAVTLLVGSTYARAQQVHFDRDATYMGALLSAADPINLNSNGHVVSGTLKADYSRDGLVFAGGTQISFYPSGRVQKSTLKSDATYGKLTIGAGWTNFSPLGAVTDARMRAKFTDANLVLPLDGDVTFNEEGRIIRYAPATTATYWLLDRPLLGPVDLNFDQVSKLYGLLMGNIGQPEFIARISKKWDAGGLPKEATAIIAPTGTHFQRLSEDGPANPAAQWTIGGFTLNGNDFGPTPKLWISDMRLKSIQVSRTVTIGGYTYQNGQIVTFDEGGGIVTPSQ